SHRRPWAPEGAGFDVNIEILEAAMAVCRRRQATTCDGSLDKTSPVEPLCSELEWELIGLGTGSSVAPHPDMPGLYQPQPLSSRPPTPLESLLPASTSAREEKRRSRIQHRLMNKLQEERRAAVAERIQSVEPLGEDRLRLVEGTLEGMKSCGPQFDLNGDFCQNMWIVKPAAKSRGRGIECFTNLSKLLSYTESKQPQAVSQWVVHKYMENPLIIARRKFDLRQWVLVTDWNPMTVWFYDHCYVRFGVEEYTTSDSNLGNGFVHLVNNSICKKSDHFGRVRARGEGM
ncbi:unnamed protein product, partial [Sphacelaria rigidula]